MKFSFIAKNRAAWPADWMCGALGVSRGGFYAWLTRPRSERSRSDEELGAKVRASFLASDRTYGARRVWHDLIAEGVSCGLHRIERLMRQQGLKARPQTAPAAARPGRAPGRCHRLQHAGSQLRGPGARTANGSPTSPTSGRRRAGFMWRRSWTCSPGASSAGR